MIDIARDMHGDLCLALIRDQVLWVLPPLDTTTNVKATEQHWLPRRIQTSKPHVFADVCRSQRGDSGSLLPCLRLLVSRFVFNFIATHTHNRSTVVVYTEAEAQEPTAQNVHAVSGWHVRGCVLAQCRAETAFSGAWNLSHLGERLCVNHKHIGVPFGVFYALAYATNQHNLSCTGHVRHRVGEQTRQRTCCMMPPCPRGDVQHERVAEHVLCAVHSAVDDNSVLLWNVHSGARVARARHGAPFKRLCALLNPTSRYIVRLQYPHVVQALAGASRQRPTKYDNTNTRNGDRGMPESRSRRSCR
eukprot:PhM_4_TR18762/c0_g1_i1/m.4319